MFCRIRTIERASNGRSFRERLEEVTIDDGLLYAIHPIDRQHITTQYPFTAHTAVVLRGEYGDAFSVYFLQTQLLRLFNETETAGRPLGINGQFILGHASFVDLTPLPPNMIMCDRPRLVAYNPDIPPRNLAKD